MLRTFAPPSSRCVANVWRSVCGATLLRQLDGYLDGLIQATAINEQVTLEQLKVAREAARRPPGFTS
jgi:hypothetical protein